MIVVADTGALYALYDAGDRHHQAARSFLDRLPTATLVVPVAVVPELDYLLREFLGVQAELDFLDGLLQGAYSLEPFAAGDLERCRAVIERYRDLDLGLVDAAVLVTADRLNTDRLFTVDERHFRAVVAASGKPYRLLPRDSEG